MEYLVCVRNCPKPFTCINSINIHRSLIFVMLLCSFLESEESVSQSGNFLQVTELIKDGARIQTCTEKQKWKEKVEYYLIKHGLI